MFFLEFCMCNSDGYSNPLAYSPASNLFPYIWSAPPPSIPCSSELFNMQSGFWWSSPPLSFFKQTCISTRIRLHKHKHLIVADPMETWRKCFKPIPTEQCYSYHRKDNSSTWGKTERLRSKQDMKVFPRLNKLHQCPTLTLTHGWCHTSLHCISRRCPVSLLWIHSSS